MDDQRRLPVALEVWGHDYRQLLDTAVAAEELGFGAFYYGESPHGLNLDTSVVLGGIAASTRSIRIGPVITNLLPTYRSFPLFVRQAHTLAVMSHGRFDLRTGTGASARWAKPWWDPIGVDYPPRDRRRAVLDEWLAALRQLWADPSSGFHGEHVHLDQLSLEPAIERPPITVAAMGPKSMQIAATHAEVWEASYLDPAAFARRARQFDDLAGSRAPRIRRALEIDVVTAPTQRARQRLEASFLAERGPDGGAALAKALTGTADEIASGLAAYRAAGVDRFVAACADPHDLTSLEVLAHAARQSGVQV